MKTKALHLIYLFIPFFLWSFEDPYTVKRISDKEFRYEFYTVKNNVHPKKDKIYFWFKGGAIHQAQYGVSGELLHGKYIKYFHSNQMAEQGYFKKGLKNGIWKTWYKNGILESVQKWHNGLPNGYSNRYSEDGNLIQKGVFSNGLKKGMWVDFLKKDTTYFKKGMVYNPKKSGKKSSKEKAIPKNNSNSFFRKIFGNKDAKQKSNGQGK